MPTPRLIYRPFSNETLKVPLHTPVIPCAATRYPDATSCASEHLVGYFPAVPLSEVGAGVAVFAPRPDLPERHERFVTLGYAEPEPPKAEVEEEEAPPELATVSVRVSDIKLITDRELNLFAPCDGCGAPWTQGKESRMYCDTCAPAGANPSDYADHVRALRRMLEAAGLPCPDLRARR